MTPGTMIHPSIWTATRLKGQPAYIGGHRGASSQAAENSKAAFEQAIRAGADFIELDWRLTSDGVPVAFHDETLARLHGDDRRIGDVALSELRAIHPSVMTIPEVLDTVAGRISVLLDTKVTESSALGHGLDLIAPHLGDGATVAFGTRSLVASETVRQRLPASPVLGLFGDYADYAALRAMGGTWARLWEDAASREAIAALQASGLNVIVMAGMPTTAGVGEISHAALVDILQRRPDAVMLNDVALGLAARETLVPSTTHSPGS